MSRRNNLFSLSQECLKPNVQFYHLTPKSYDVKQIFAGKKMSKWKQLSWEVETDAKINIPC